MAIKLFDHEPDWRLPFDLQNAAATIVNALLADGQLAEASVHRPKRGSIWIASFTGPAGGQVWKSTGSTDRNQALLVAKRWEAQARAERLRLGRPPRKPILRARRQEPGTTRSGPLTQLEVAALLGMSERAVREIERRALEKIKSHPALRQVWQKYLAGELDEQALVLTAEEVAALFGLAHTPEERHLIRKILRVVQD